MEEGTISLRDKSDQFTFSVEATLKDSYGKPKIESIDDITFDIFILYKKPTLLNPNYPLALISNNPLLVNVSGFSYIDKPHLNTIDFKNSNCTFCYVIRTLPKSGELRLGKYSLKPGSTFTQKNINSNELTYRHHSEDNQDADFFIFSIVDDKGKILSSDAFPIQIARNNTAPEFVNLFPISVRAGSNTPISTSNLCVRDSEQGPKDLSYQILSPPKNGTLTKKGEGELNKDSSFTQSDINKGLLSYKHLEASSTNDCFTFIVDDHAGGVTEVTIAEITIGNDSKEKTKPNQAESANLINEKAAKEANPKKKENQGIVAVNKKGRAIIPTEELKLFNDSMGNASFHTVVINTFPKAGRIVRSKLLENKGIIGKSRSVRAKESLSKKDFDDGLIAYIHSGINSEKIDIFEASLLDKNEKVIKTKSCKIEIIEDNNAPVIVENHLLHVQVGYVMTISNQLLKVIDDEQSPGELIFSMQIPPSNGSLFKNQEKLRREGTFTQEDIDNGIISYSHSGEDNESDSITFSVDDGTGGMLSGILFKIIITKKPFALLKNNPLSVGANSSSNFQESNLSLIHTGVTKPQLRYVLKKSPGKGDIYVNDVVINLGGSFTQEDIKKGHVRFTHSSSYETSK